MDGRTYDKKCPSFCPHHRQTVIYEPTYLPTYFEICIILSNDLLDEEKMPWSLLEEAAKISLHKE
jgi:hypothetical protein